MRGSILSFAATALLLGATAQAAPIAIPGNPFAGSTALTTPGRQVVGNELFTPFVVADDTFVLQGSPFEFVNSISFANGTIDTVPPAGTNVVVLRSFDNDNDTTTPFLAGNAANLIAEQITTSGPGLFVYFNSGLQLPRLVYSTNLSDNTADLKILARLTNLGGATGQGEMALFSAADFAFAPAPIPEPSTLLLLGSGAAFLAFVRRGAKRTRHTPG